MSAPSVSTLFLHVLNDEVIDAISQVFRIYQEIYCGCSDACRTFCFFRGRLYLGGIFSAGVACLYAAGDARRWLYVDAGLLGLRTGGLLLGAGRVGSAAPGG